MLQRRFDGRFRRTSTDRCCLQAQDVVLFGHRAPPHVGADRRATCLESWRARPCLMAVAPPVPVSLVARCADPAGVGPPSFARARTRRVERGRSLATAIRCPHDRHPGRRRPHGRCHDASLRPDPIASMTAPWGEPLTPVRWRDRLHLPGPSVVAARRSHPRRHASSRWVTRACRTSTAGASRCRRTCAAGDHHGAAAPARAAAAGRGPVGQHGRRRPVPTRRDARVRPAACRSWRWRPPRDPGAAEPAPAWHARVTAATRRTYHRSLRRRVCYSLRWQFAVVRRSEHQNLSSRAARHQLNKSAAPLSIRSSSGDHQSHRVTRSA